MGGATSRFEDTNWDAANGQLESISDTIDGCPPTERYEMYEILKKAVNQREFDIVDSNQNLLYTTRPVPGTLAWFDVLGPGSVGEYQDYRLRVHVDLSRRTWVVYRYSKPVFAGQKPAMKCTPQLGNKTNAAETGNDDDGKPLQQYELYKTAHITVSWSRYIAIAARYGPPPEDHFSNLLHWDEGSTGSENAGDDTAGEKAPSDDTVGDKSEIDGDEDDLFQQAAQIAARRRSDSVGEDDSQI